MGHFQMIGFCGDGLKTTPRMEINSMIANRLFEDGGQLIIQNGHYMRRQFDQTHFQPTLKLVPISGITDVRGFPPFPDQ